MQLASQAALVAAQQSITNRQSQESVSSLPPADTSSTKLAIEQYQRQILLKDQEIIKLRSQVEQLSSEIFSHQQENDSLSFNRSQL